MPIGEVHTQETRIELQKINRQSPRAIATMNALKISPAGAAAHGEKQQTGEDDEKDFVYLCWMTFDSVAKSMPTGELSVDHRCHLPVL